MSNIAKIFPNDEGKRLDLIIPLYFPQYSRTSARKLLDQGNVLLNGEVEYRPNFKVETDQEIEVIDAVELERNVLPPYNFQIPIIYQDQDLVIVNKPAGMKVHPTSLHDEKTLLNALYFTLQTSLGEYGTNLINRIDKETSGLVACSVSSFGAWYYHRQFSTGEVYKEYLAVVASKWISKYGTRTVEVSNFLSKNHLTGKQEIVPKGGKHAHTSFRLITQIGEFALLSAIPHTGRTHQIRVHLEDLGFPILGDVRYGGEKFSRLMLHAWKLKLTKSDGGRIEAEAEPPLEFEKLIDTN